MALRSLLLSAALGLVAVGGLAHAPDALARGHVAVDVRVAPPPPRVEHVVVRPGYVRVPGYWRWTGHRHVWVAGYSTRARPGFVYTPARWVRHGAHWRFHAGAWVRR